MTFLSPRGRLVAVVAVVALCAPLLVATSAQAALRTRLSASWSDTTVTVGQAATVRGSISPTRRRRTVFLQRRVDQRWVTLATRRTLDGSYRMRIPTARADTAAYRVRVARNRRLRHGYRANLHGGGRRHPGSCLCR